MWYTDSFGWPITARPYSSTSTFGLLEVSEVLNQIVRRACEFKPVEAKRSASVSSSSSTTTTISTTASIFTTTAKHSVEAEKDAFNESVTASVSYPDLVSLIILLRKELKIAK